jgi:hypothetical protein
MPVQGGGGGGERGLFGDLLGAAFQVVTAEMVRGSVTGRGIRGRGAKRGGGRGG